MPTSSSAWPGSGRRKRRWRHKAWAAAEEETRRRFEAEEKRKAEGRKRSGPTPEPPSAEPEGKAQRNFTDPESRILKSKDGFVQGYNTQAAVDCKAQIIVAHALTQGTSDQNQITVLNNGIEAKLGARPKETSADAGYGSEANLQLLADRGIAGDNRHGAGQARCRRQARRWRAADAGHAAKTQTGRMAERYRLRKQIVEPVFGQIKQARGFRQFLLRDVDKVRAEWALICTAHNITKLAGTA